MVQVLLNHPFDWSGDVIVVNKHPLLWTLIVKLVSLYVGGTSPTMAMEAKTFAIMVWQAVAGLKPKVFF